MVKSRSVIAGGSGFLGLDLARHLASLGHAVTILSRNPPRSALNPDLPAALADLF